jgi:hypothetical protein
MNKSVSPSRRYVAMCSNTNFEGYRFKAFTLPERDPDDGRDLENNSRTASWYFLNRLDFVACIDGCITEEDFKDVVEKKEMFSEKEA